LAQRRQMLAVLGEEDEAFRVDFWNLQSIEAWPFEGEDRGRLVEGQGNYSSCPSYSIFCPVSN